MQVLGLTHSSIGETERRRIDCIDSRTHTRDSYECKLTIHMFVFSYTLGSGESQPPGPPEQQKPIYLPSLTRLPDTNREERK